MLLELILSDHFHSAIEYSDACRNIGGAFLCITTSCRRGFLFFTFLALSITCVTELHQTQKGSRHMLKHTEREGMGFPKSRQTSYVPLLCSVCFLVLLSPLGSYGVDADFGDAPDLSRTSTPVFGPFNGHYPTRSNTTNSAFVNRTGARHADITQDWLGTTVTSETEALTIDQDSGDDGLKGLDFEFETNFFRTYLVFEARRATGTSFSAARWLNAVVDLNQNGEWKPFADPVIGFAQEWVAANLGFNYPSASIYTTPIIVGPFSWTEPFRKPETWIRATLTNSPFDTDIFGSQGWDGSAPSGGFAQGETEDYFWAGIGRGIRRASVPDFYTVVGTGADNTAHVVWMPTTVPVGNFATVFAIYVCNDSPNPETISVSWEFGNTNNPMVISRIGSTAPVPSGRCVWLTFTAAWQYAGTARVNGARPVLTVGSKKTILPGQGDYITFQDYIGTKDLRPFIRATAEGAAVVLMEDKYVHTQANFPTKIRDLLTEEIPDRNAIADTPLDPDPDEVTHAVEIVGDFPINPPRPLLLLPFDPQTPGYVDNVGIPLKYDATARLWVPLSPYQTESTEHIIAVEITEPGHYGVGRLRSTPTEGEGQLEGEGEGAVSGTYACSTSLTGSQVVPPTASSALGVLNSTLDVNGGVWSGTLLQNVAEPTVAQVREGGAGSNGPLLYDLGLLSGPQLDFTVNGISAALKNALITGNAYIEVRSLDFPNGEIRGQINCIGTSEGEGSPEGVIEGEGAAEGGSEGSTEGVVEGTPEGVPEGGSEGEGAPFPTHHSADTNQDNRIGLSELLRVIQFFNSGGFHCAPGTEDGYGPGIVGDQTCPPHAADYNPQDWRISLSELLRVIQFYNSGGYHACPGQGTEDGYCVGPA